MSISLQKGQKVSLTKERAGLSKVLVGLGWNGPDIDCDAFALLLSNGKLADMGDIVYYGNLNHRSFSVKHMGDNTIGGGGGDDEQITVSLPLVPEKYDRIVLAVIIFKAQAKGQNFTMVNNAYIRIADQSSSSEICRYDLSENGNCTVMIFGELYRNNGEWKFNAVGQGDNVASIVDFAAKYK